MNLFEKVTAYRDGARILHDWIGQGGTAVEKEQAQKRADVCLKCPMNDTAWEPTKIMGDVIRQQVELKNDLQMRVEGEKSLGTCSACLCALRLKVWVPLSYLTKYAKEDDINRYDSNCWVRSELQ